MNFARNNTVRVIKFMSELTKRRRTLFPASNRYSQNSKRTSCLAAHLQLNVRCNKDANISQPENSVVLLHTHTEPHDKIGHANMHTNEHFSIERHRRRRPADGISLQCMQNTKRCESSVKHEIVSGAETLAGELAAAAAYLCVQRLRHRVVGRVSFADGNRTTYHEYEHSMYAHPHAQKGNVTASAGSAVEI